GPTHEGSPPGRSPRSRPRLRRKAPTRPLQGPLITPMRQRPSLLPQKPDQQFIDVFRLLLLHPMTGAVDQMTAEHTGASGLLHALEIARALVSAPVALAGDKQGRHVDRLSRE